MKITARCHPLLEPILPKPVLAEASLPAWLKSMPSQAVSPTLGGETVRTLKHCPPFIDALSTGVLLPLATDIHVEQGHISWDWDPPIIDDAPITRSPVGVHVPEQVEGAPIDHDGRLLVKFTNFWTLEAPPGWSLLFTQPFNRPELPFTTLTGLVGCDGFKHGYVHFPVLLDAAFDGTIKRGTPIAQIIAIRREAIDLEVRTMNPWELEASVAVQEALSAEPGAYRKTYRRKAK